MHNHSLSVPNLEAVDSVVKMFCHGFPSAILVHLSSRNWEMGDCEKGSALESSMAPRNALVKQAGSHV